MAAAETMTVARDIDDTVKDVDKRLEGVDNNVQGVNELVKDVDKRVKGVDGRVGSVIQGRLSFPVLALTPNLSSPITPARCKGDWSSDPTGVQSSQRPQP